ncbi:MAG: hypothetical protein LBC84_06740 [Prevotellaceae bacterium]|jgi:hypothetical protein|nr:hypothetical protein [Prevotellaceae bacterium]
MKATLNQYHFGRHYNFWGIWQYTHVTETGSSSTHIKDVFSYEEAVIEVYRHNGWGTPKSVKRQF